jgi:hypothetical protein
MSVLTTTLIGLGIAGAVGAFAAREHRQLRRARQSLLDRCAEALDRHEIRHGGDGFPRLAGDFHGRRVMAELLPDTMVIRRLPQLWLSVTLPDTLGDLPSLAVLVRPAGYEFYSLTSRLSCALDAPATFPSEVVVRGSDARADRLLWQLTPHLATVLMDPRVKEIAVTSKGLRIIVQAGEGRRGEHLLLRQAVFDDAEVPARELANRLTELETLLSAIDVPQWKAAA